MTTRNNHGRSLHRRDEREDDEGARAGHLVRGIITGIPLGALLLLGVLHALESPRGATTVSAISAAVAVLIALITAISQRL
jgi:hypothetical protein